MHGMTQVLVIVIYIVFILLTLQKNATANIRLRIFHFNLTRKCTDSRKTDQETLFCFFYFLLFVCFQRNWTVIRVIHQETTGRKNDLDLTNRYTKKSFIQNRQLITKPYSHDILIFIWSAVLKQCSQWQLRKEKKRCFFFWLYWTNYKNK